ncbi:MAG: polysaccharide pyruvyl transferase family protein [Actinocatenispora sp.]
MSDPHRVLYVGWTGRGNLGDDAIAEALTPRLSNVEPWHVPTDVAGFARRIAAGGTVHAGNRALLLGGGTVIGRRNWRMLLRATSTLLARRRPWHLIGAGVEDPAFQGRNSFSDSGELARWVDTCARFERVTVRGPRSAELLASVGVAAEIVGDPALLHEAPPVSARDRLVGVNLGFGDDLWGHDHDRVVGATADLVRGLVADGWSARLLVINQADRRYAEDCLRRAGIPADRAEIRGTDTVADYLTAAGECTVLVAERLHALVLGAIVGTPLVGLEYQPKCADFLRSIEATRHNYRTDAVSAEDLRAAVDDLTARHDTESSRLTGQVEVLRGRLREELGRLRVSLGEVEPVVTG